jgi:hypothetical protein
MIATAKAPDSDEISKRQAQGLFKTSTQIRSQNLRQGTLELEFNNI